MRKTLYSNAKPVGARSAAEVSVAPGSVELSRTLLATAVSRTAIHHRAVEQIRLPGEFRKPQVGQGEAAGRARVILLRKLLSCFNG